jgi:hypothetical protein
VGSGGSGEATESDEDGTALSGGASMLRGWRGAGGTGDTRVTFERAEGRDVTEGKGDTDRIDDTDPPETAGAFGLVVRLVGGAGRATWRGGASGRWQW